MKNVIKKSESCKGFAAVRIVILKKIIIILYHVSYQNSIYCDRFPVLYDYTNNDSYSYIYETTIQLVRYYVKTYYVVLIGTSNSVR